MANSMRVSKAGRPYVIEVNDKGDTISFDLTDSTIGVRLLAMLNRIQSIRKKYADKIAGVSALPEAEIPGAPITQQQARMIVLINDFYRDARKALDIFLGAGACEKIFGATNYPSMFYDLLAQLAPHFEKMGLEVAAMKTELAQKYLELTGRGLVLK